MAVFAALLAPAGSSTGTQSSRSDLTGTILTTASSAEILMGAYQYIAINANGDMNIRFGGTGLPAATASDFRIPANTIAVYPISKMNPAIRIFNPGGSTITYWIQFLVAQV